MTPPPPLPFGVAPADSYLPMITSTPLTAVFHRPSHNSAPCRPGLLVQLPPPHHYANPCPGTFNVHVDNPAHILFSQTLNLPTVSVPTPIITSGNSVPGTPPEVSVSSIQPSDQTRDRLVHTVCYPHCNMTRVNDIPQTMNHSTYFHDPLATSVFHFPPIMR